MKRTGSAYFLVLFPLLLIGAAFLFYPQLHGLLYRIQRNRTASILLSRISSYHSVAGDSSELYYTDLDEEFVSLIQRSIDLYYPLMAKDFQIARAPRLKVVLYPGETDMRQNVGDIRGRTPMGVYYGGVIHILSPRVWAADTDDAGRMDLFLEQGPMVHEIAHYLTDLKTGGNFEVWLTEGVALYYEYKYTAFEWRRDLKEEAAGLSFEELSGQFNRLNQGVAYRKAFDLVNGLVERKGEDALQTLLAGGLFSRRLLV